MPCWVGNTPKGWDVANAVLHLVVVVAEGVMNNNLGVGSDLRNGPVLWGALGTGTRDSEGPLR
jgi:hypothetical protein